MPELALRKAVHALGARYRVDSAPLKRVRRRADLVFRKARVAVYLDGCFWHGCPTHYKAPSGPNAQYWQAKIVGNSRRDRVTDAELLEEGWRVVRVWEHEDPVVAALRVLAEVEAGLADRVVRS